MTDKEIKELASRYAEAMCSESSYNEDIVERNIDLQITKDDAEPVIKWLSSRYCLVEKSKVKESYREHKESYDRLCKSQWDETPYQCEEQGAMDELESLFGKELFTNTEQ